MTKQYLTIGYLAAQSRVPPAVIESLIKALGIEPAIMLNEQRQYDAAELEPVTAGVIQYMRGVKVEEIYAANPEARPTTEAGAHA